MPARFGPRRAQPAAGTARGHAGSTQMLTSCSQAAFSSPAVGRKHSQPSNGERGARTACILFQNSSMNRWRREAWQKWVLWGPAAADCLLPVAACRCQQPSNAPSKRINSSPQAHLGHGALWQGSQTCRRRCTARSAAHAPAKRAVKMLPTGAVVAIQARPTAKPAMPTAVAASQHTRRRCAAIAPNCGTPSTLQKACTSTAGRPVAMSVHAANQPNSVVYAS